MKIDFKNKDNLVLGITIGIVALLLVSSILIQSKSVTEYKKTDIEGLREDELKTQISKYQTRYEEALEQYEENKNKRSEYEATANENEKTSELLDAELEQSNKLLGLTDVKGEGVIITLEDTDEATYTSENIRYLINELKYAGAEAISVNGNRIINLTDIVTINGNDVIVMYGNSRIGSPYEIKAIGDRKYLTSTLNMKNSGFVDLMKSSGLNVTVKESDNITINKYNGNIKSKYMKEEN